MIVDCLTCDNCFDLGIMNDHEMKCWKCGVAFGSRWRFADMLEHIHTGYKLLDFCPTVSNGVAMTDEQVKDSILAAMQEQLLLTTEKENLILVKDFFIDGTLVTQWAAVLGKEDALMYKPRG